MTTASNALGLRVEQRRGSSSSAGISRFWIPSRRRDVDGGGDHVVGRLAHVDGVVGVDRATCRPGRLLSCSLATPAITSLVFMFVEVPLPVWKMSTTNWSSCLPSATAWAAWTIGSPSSAVEQPQVHVDLRRGLLDQAHRPDERAREPERADLEVQLGAGAVWAP